MSDASDPESRSHEPGEKKIRDAIERGESPVAPDVTLLGAMSGIYFAFEAMRLTNESHIGALGSVIESVGRVRIETAADAYSLAISLANAALLPIVAIVGAILLGSLIVGVAPQSPRLTTKRLKLDGKRLNPFKGIERIVGRKGLVDFGKSVVKSIVGFAAVALSLKPYWRQVGDGRFSDVDEAAGMAYRAIEGIALALLCVALLFAIVDLAVSRLAWRKRLRMTHQEVKDETKQAEGDPLVKMRMRSLALSRARSRMMREISSATMVIANPTHFAVALRYIREEGGAPVVIAKGQELTALKIRSLAEEGQIPVVDNPELARAMYRSVEIGQLIPPEFYRAVAEIVNFISARQPSARKS